MATPLGLNTNRLATLTDDSYPHDGVKMASNDDYYHFLRSRLRQYAMPGIPASPAAYLMAMALPLWGTAGALFISTMFPSARRGGKLDPRPAWPCHDVWQHNDDKFSHYEAGSDSFVNLLYTFDASGALTGAIVNVPCPSQNSEGAYKLSASFWNEVRVAVKAKYGDIFILPQTAAGGDLAPRILHYHKAQARRFKLKYAEEPETIAELNMRRDIAERIENAFTETLAWARKDIQTSLP